VTSSLGFRFLKKKLKPMEKILISFGSKESSIRCFVISFGSQESSIKCFYCGELKSSPNFEGLVINGYEIIKHSPWTTLSFANLMESGQPL